MTTLHESKLTNICVRHTTRHNDPEIMGKMRRAASRD